METGDYLTWNGRVYVLRGFEPMSVPERRVELEDPVSHERIRVPLREVEESDGPLGQSNRRST